MITALLYILAYYLVGLIVCSIATIIEFKLLDYESQQKFSVSIEGIFGCALIWPIILVCIPFWIVSENKNEIENFFESLLIKYLGKKD